MYKEGTKTTGLVPAFMTVREEVEKFVIDNGSDHVPTFGGDYEGGIQIQQIADEIAPCIDEIVKSGLKVFSYLEIGAAAGGTTFLMNKFLNPNAIVIIDDNQHPKHHIRPYILRDIPHHEIIGNSHTDGVVNLLSEKNLLFKVIMIDGDHSYDGVKKDFDIYKEFLSPGGFVIFHDSALPEWGIMRLVEEIKSDDNFEFIGEYKTSQKNIKPLGVALFRKVE